jgi:hypothetical protein
MDQRELVRDFSVEFAKENVWDCFKIRMWRKSAKGLKE